MLDKVLLYNLLIVFLLLSCRAQKEIQIKRIIKGVIIENFHNYTFSNDPCSVYVIGKDIVSVRSISEYNNTGSLVKFSIYKPEGILVYSLKELEEDTLLIDLSGGRSVKVWKFIGNNEITNRIDTLKIKTAQNSFNKQILVNRKENTITIFE